jgi:hypothetical protein
MINFLVIVDNISVRNNGVLAPLLMARVCDIRGAI